MIASISAAVLNVLRDLPSDQSDIEGDGETDVQFDYTVDDVDSDDTYLTASPTIIFLKLKAAVKTYQTRTSCCHNFKCGG